MRSDQKMLTAKDFRNRILDRHGKMGRDACEIMASAIQAVDPYQCIKESVILSNDELVINQQRIHLSFYKRVYIVGFGKASVPMAKALMDILEDNITSAYVVTKDRSFLDEDGYQQKLNVFVGDHPVPGNNSILSTQAVLNSLPLLREDDLVLIVISGGGSALFTNPMPEITLAELRKLTDVLLRSGADITEINTLRKHLDLVKGGRLAQRLQPATVHSFILSDVIGDRLDMIASGPTVPDPTTYQDAMDIIDRYDLKGRIPDSIIEIMKRGISGEMAETLKQGALPASRVINHLIGTNNKALQAARQKGESLGYHSSIVSTNLTGSTQDVAEFLEGIIHTLQAYHEPVKQPACFLFGGETTVLVAEGGLGGRNQDLVLRMIPRLNGQKGVLFISLATDGEDGPTDAAGAASDALIIREEAAVMGLDVHTAIDTSNSYHYLNERGALIKTGSTGTNVNDLILILVDDQIREC